MSSKEFYPIGMIPYVNMAPYRQLGPPSDCRFVPLIPSKSVTALRSGEVLAAAVPVGGLFVLEDLVEPVGQFGIAAKRECMSVIFFSDRPVESLNRHCRIRLTGDSATSVRLLYLLLLKLLGPDRLPRLAAPGEIVNGELLIGDAAIRQAIHGRNATGQSKEEQRQPALPFVTDLAVIWRRIYHLPFVFARWAVRRDADEEVKKILIQWLEEFRRREAELVAACVAPAAQELDIDRATAKRYFKVIHRCLDDTDLVGQKRFMDEFLQKNQDPLFD